MTSRYDITCDFGRAMIGTSLKEIARTLKAKKMLFRFFQHFKSLKTFSIDIQLQETREKIFVSYAL